MALSQEASQDRKIAAEVFWPLLPEWGETGCGTFSDHRCRSTEVMHVSRLERYIARRCDCSHTYGCVLRVNFNNTECHPEVSPHGG